MENTNKFSPKDHMSMLQFRLSDIFFPAKYDAITIDVRNALVHCTTTRPDDANAIIKSFPLQDTDIQELLPIISFDSFREYFTPQNDSTPHKEIGFYDEGNTVHYVCFSDTGIYCSGNYRLIYEGNPMEATLHWFREKYCTYC